jgi:hypothetical protein
VGLAEIVSIEEKYDSLLENMHDLETTLLSLSARHLAFSNIEFLTISTARSLLTRKVSNILSSMRLYRDAFPQHMKRLVGANTKDAFAQPFRSEGAPTSYLIMEEIGNYGQHQESPVSSVSFSSRGESETEARISFSTTPKFDAVEVARSRRDIEPALRNAMTKLGSNAQLMPLLREAIEYVGDVHEMLRARVADQQKVWIAASSDLTRRYKSRYPKATAGLLRIRAEDKDQRITGETYVERERLDYLSYLQRKNRTPKNFAKRFVRWSGHQ